MDPHKWPSTVTLGLVEAGTFFAMFALSVAMMGGAG
jgi:hypothetical protein